MCHNCVSEFLETFLEKSLFKHCPILLLFAQANRSHINRPGFSIFPSPRTNASASQVLGWLHYWYWPPLTDVPRDIPQPLLLILSPRDTSYTSQCVEDLDYWRRVEVLLDLKPRLCASE